MHTHHTQAIDLGSYKTYVTTSIDGRLSHPSTSQTVVYLREAGIFSGARVDEMQKDNPLATVRLLSTVFGIQPSSLHYPFVSPLYNKPFSLRNTSPHPSVLLASFLQDNIDLSTKATLIAIPPYFTNNKDHTEIQTVLIALSLLRLDPSSIQLIPQSLSLLYSYLKSLSQPYPNQSIMILDLGYSSSFFLLATISSDMKVKVVESKSHQSLGLIYIDQLLFDFLCGKIKEQFDVDVMDSPKLCMGLKKSVEQCRTKLSVSDSAVINLVVGFDSTKQEPMEFDFTVDISAFELLFEGFILAQLNSFISSVESPIRIDRVLLIGGMSFVRSVLEAVNNRFKGKVSRFTDDWHSVSDGAVIHSLIGRDWSIDDHVLGDFNFKLNQSSIDSLTQIMDVFDSLQESRKEFLSFDNWSVKNLNKNTRKWSKKFKKIKQKEVDYHHELKVCLDVAEGVQSKLIDCHQNEVDDLKEVILALFSVLEGNNEDPQNNVSFLKEFLTVNDRQFNNLLENGMLLNSGVSLLSFLSEEFFRKQNFRAISSVFDLFSPFLINDYSITFIFGCSLLYETGDLKRAFDLLLSVKGEFKSHAGDVMGKSIKIDGLIAEMINLLIDSQDLQNFNTLMSECNSLMDSFPEFCYFRKQFDSIKFLFDLNNCSNHKDLQFLDCQGSSRFRLLVNWIQRPNFPIPLTDDLFCDLFSIPLLKRVVICKVLNLAFFQEFSVDSAVSVVDYLLDSHIQNPYPHFKFHALALALKVMELDRNEGDDVLGKVVGSKAAVLKVRKVKKLVVRYFRFINQ
ncbi:hypothetical protein P9112_004451 [Eukaryota sp. TZLM1-RC]